MRVLTATGCYLVSTVLASLLTGHLPSVTSLVLAVLAGVVGTLVTGALSVRLRLRTAARVAVLFGLVYLLETVSNWVEAVLFISTTSKLIPLTGAVLAAGLAVPVGLLWRPAAVEDRSRPARTRPWWSWVWRVLVTALLWVPVYFVFVAADTPFVTRYYHETGTVFKIPSTGVLATAELTRGLIHALVLGGLAVLLASGGRPASGERRRAWLWLAVAFSAYNAWLPLIQHAGWPYYLRAANLVEITCDGVVYGAIVALLLSPRSGTPVKADDAALVDPGGDVRDR